MALPPRIASDFDTRRGVPAGMLTGAPPVGFVKPTIQPIQPMQPMQPMQPVQPVQPVQPTVEQPQSAPLPNADYIRMLKDFQAEGGVVGENATKKLAEAQAIIDANQAQQEPRMTTMPVSEKFTQPVTSRTTDTLFGDYTKPAPASPTLAPATTQPDALGSYTDFLGQQELQGRALGLGAIESGDFSGLAGADINKLSQDPRNVRKFLTKQ